MGVEIPYTLEMVEDAEYVMVVYAGEVTKKAHDTSRAEAMRTLTAKGWSRLLVDARQIDAKMTALDDFEFTQEHQSSLPSSVRIAVIHRPNESERFRFIENVAVNRGIGMKVFTDPVEATNWLTDK